MVIEVLEDSKNAQKGNLGLLESPKTVVDGGERRKLFDGFLDEKERRENEK